METWSLGEMMWSILWFALFAMWMYFVVVVVLDVFRDHELGGFAKFLWVVALIVFPFLGLAAYLIARGDKMGARAIERAQEKAVKPTSYRVVPNVGGSQYVSEQLRQAADLHDRGFVDDTEFAVMKQELMRR